MTPDGVGEVYDFMPVVEGGPTDRHQLIRHLRVARGQMQFLLDVQPGFDYGRASHSVDITGPRAVFRSAGGMELTLHTAGPSEVSQAGTAERVGDGLRVTFTLREGQTGGVVLESMGGEPVDLPGPVAGDGHAVGDDPQTDDLPAVWCAGGGCHLRATRAGRGRAQLDYRFTWIRDGSLAMHALSNLGYLEEAGRFGAWINDPGDRKRARAGR